VSFIEEVFFLAKELNYRKNQIFVIVENTDELITITKSVTRCTYSI